MATNTLSFRPARADDRDAVFAMIATVWEGTDYIPSIWQEWLHAEDGPLIVGTFGERPVALCKLTGLGAHEDWIEGVRVDPEQRGQGFARALIRHMIDLSRGRGKRSLRFQTSETTLTMHHLGEELGFRLAYAPDLYLATPLIGAIEYRPLPTSRLPSMLVDLERSPLLAQTGGLYSYGWTTFDMTPERLREHLEHGAVVGVSGDQAWTIIEPSNRGGNWIGHAEGSNHELVRLFHALRFCAAPTDAEYFVRLHVPRSAQFLPALLEAGYERGEHGARVYEYMLQ